MLPKNIANGLVVFKINLMKKNKIEMIQGKILLFCLFSVFNLFFAQNKNILVTVISTDIKSNLTLIYLVPDEIFYKNSILYETAKKNKQDKFLFNISIGNEDQFPLPYIFTSKTSNRYTRSLPFLLRKGEFEFKLSATQAVPVLSKVSPENKVIVEDQEKFSQFFNSIIDDLYNYNDEKNKIIIDDLLLKYSKDNPNSYMLFWTLVSRLQTHGFNDSTLLSFNNLSYKIRNSTYGKYLDEKLKISALLSEGQTFPELNLKNKQVSTFFGKKFTLVDFWFSYCSPCIEVMPKYKELYSKYNNDFEILGISIDRTKDVENWKKVIKDNELNWPQFLDENGVRTKYYEINKFPTTFLLDSKGKILKKNISPEELEKFLEMNL